MKILIEKYIPSVKYAPMDKYEVWLFNKILLKRKYVHPLRKYICKSEWEILGI